MTDYPTTKTLAIFGATGRTGRVLVREALLAGYRVRALVRDPEKLRAQQGEHERLTIIPGDALDPEAVARSVEGADAVISVLGHTKDSPEDLLTTATRHIVAAMRRHGVRRLLLLTGAAVRAPEDAPKLIDRLIGGVLKLVARKVYEDARNAVHAVRESGLEWTVVRAPMLTDGPKTGAYRVGFVGKESGVRISRADLADFMLQELERGEYVGHMPVVSA